MYDNMIVSTYSNAPTSAFVAESAPVACAAKRHAAPLARLRDQRGESLVETIVAFLVITIALLAFAAMATFGFNLTKEAESLDRVNTNMVNTVDISYGNANYNTNFNRATGTSN